MPKPKILMLITNLTFGGAQRVFHDHNELLSSRFDVSDAVFNLADGQAFETPQPVIDLAVTGGGSWLNRIANFARRVRRLSAIKRALRPALTISHLEGADYVNILSNGGGKRLLCVHGSKLHDANIRGPLGFIRKRLIIPRLYNRADGIVTVSREIAVELESMGVRRELLRPIPNFFDPAAIRARSLEPLSAAEQSMFAGPPVLVASGRLAFGKQQKEMITIVAQLLERRPVRLLFLGDGELKQVLIDHTLSLGLRVAEEAGRDADVLFLGFQDNPFRFQRHATAFVLSSGWEGFPMVLGEAMACGLPIVSADCPTGPREFLAPATIGQAVRPLRQPERGEFGLLMPIPNHGDGSTIEQWAVELDRLLGDAPALQAMADQSLARAEDFTRDKIGAQWLALVEELVATSA